MELHKDWKIITSESDWNKAVEESFHKPVVLFKHSTRCGISAHKLHDLVLEWNFSTDDLTLYYLDLLTYRSISDLIAKETRIIHQSPQLILLKNGKAADNTSHAYVTVSFLKKSLKETA